MKNILTINAGSSSLKASVYSVNRNGNGLSKILTFYAKHLLATPKFELIEGLGEKEVIELDYNKDNLISSIVKSFFNLLKSKDLMIDCVSHRVVHGGTVFSKPIVINEENLDELKKFIPLAPLHQPHNLKLIEETKNLHPKITQIACFDTMFHMNTRDEMHSLLAIPEELREEGVQKYGFHGLSYEFVTGKLIELLGKEENDIKNKGIKTVTAHLGSGCSMLSSNGVAAVSSTMGFSALDGLPMGTRCGRLDAGVILYMLQKGWDYKKIETTLYKESGWKGLSGISGDMKVLLDNKDSNEKIRKTVEHFLNEIAFNVGGFMSHLGGLDNIVFTGGVGENSPYIREKVIEKLNFLGIELDGLKNNCNTPGRISKDSSPINVYLIPTNEEYILAKHAYLLNK